MSDPYPAADASTASAKPHRPRLLDRILSLVRREPEDREGIVAVLDAARERELIDADAYSMLKGALAVSEQTAVDIMVPRVRMDLLDVSQPIATLMPEIIETAHSRFPVFEGARDNIIGVVMTKDLLRHLLNTELTLRDLVRPAVFIPESKRLNVLLQEFRRNRNHIAIVIDEHGGITGLVTLEDVLEQIVGAIEDEYDVDGAKTIFPDGVHAWRLWPRPKSKPLTKPWMLTCQQVSTTLWVAGLRMSSAISPNAVMPVNMATCVSRSCALMRDVHFGFVPKPAARPNPCESHL